MITREQGKIYFGREILSILKRGDLVKTKNKNGFPFIDNNLAVYLGSTQIGNFKKNTVDEAIGIIGREYSNLDTITEIRYLLEDTSLIGNYIINPTDEFIDRFKELGFDTVTGILEVSGFDTFRRFAEMIAEGRIWFYGEDHKDYPKYDEMLRRHNL